jgi:sugar-specific transcriptional regulator TrmB
LAGKENTDLLIGLGLSPNQAKVYQAILKSGSTTVGTIAKSSSVRREDVYKVLPSLEKMGLTEKLLGKPAQIRATSVAGALASLIVSEKVKSDERIATMKEKFQELVKTKWDRPVKLGDDEDSLYALIPDGNAIATKLSSMVANTKEQISWIEILKKILQGISRISEEYEKAMRRGVNIRIIIEDCIADDKIRKQMQTVVNTKSVQIRCHQEPLNMFEVFESQQALIAANRKSEQNEGPSLWTTDKNLIGVLNGYFENVWKESEELIQDKMQNK